MLKEGDAMSELKTETEPAEVGLDQGRLQRIGRHFARYVDDGRLPGWLITVSRYGRLAYVAGYGSRDVEAGLPAETDTVWRLYSMTKPVTSVAAMMMHEEGRFKLNDPVSSSIPSFAVVLDPAEELTVSFFTQLLPSSAYPIRSELRQLVYQALID
jgi:CubicO group peptidase (beta-lactamase class C family)